MKRKNEKNIALTLRENRRTEVEIVGSWQGDPNDPVVSICCATYNHVDFIEDAICGFLAQETTHSFEIIIRDDASTDGTTAIVERYASDYPNIVRAVVNRENLFRKGVRPRHAWPKLARGKYIALCEGDDFWISRNKLQAQLDFLENNIRFGISCHPSITTRSNRIIYPDCAKPSAFSHGFCFSAEDLLDHNFVFTNTVVFRAHYLKGMPVHNLHMGDWPLWTYIASESDAFFHTELLGFYRQHGGGAWSSLQYSEAVRHNLDFYDYVERAMPRLADKARESRRNYVEGIAISHQNLRNKVHSFKKNPFLFLMKKVLGKYQD